MDKVRWEYYRNVINVDDMADVMDYLHQKKGWSLHDASVACHQYKNYLFLLAKYKKVIPPSYEISQAWRAHILTEPKDYQEMCKEIYREKYNELSVYKPFYQDRKFISKRDEENFENITVDLFEKEFNLQIYEFSHQGAWSWFIDKMTGMFHHGINKIIFTVAVPFAIVMYAGSVIKNNELLAQTSEKLQIQVDRVSHQYEDRAKICKYTESDKRNPNYLIQLYDFNKILYQYLNDLITSYDYAYQQGLITDELLQEMHNFIKKYDVLINKYEPYMCNAPYEDPETAKKERGDMIANIRKSEEDLQQKFFRIKVKNTHISFTPEGPTL